MDDLLSSVFGSGDDAFLMAGGAMAMMAMLMVVFVAVNMFRARAEVRRRAADSVSNAGAIRDGGEARAGLAGNREALNGVLMALAKRFVEADGQKAKVLKAQLVQAGYFTPQAPAWYFAARFGLAAALGLGALVVVPLAMEEVTFMTTLVYALVLTALGYLAPSVFLSRRIERRTTQVRSGFPDFMDLMVVCSEAGLSMEASIERVSREITSAYPALAENLFITTLEIRAGRAVSEALERLAQRSGVQEAKSFATLLQQSEELGSSITQSLKVYSDDMRNKRMMKAEEKAYALPAKLVVPLTMFVFPVLLVTLLLPVVIRMQAY